MTSEDTVDVRAIKAGLRDLARRMPEQPSVVHEFGALLAAYMDDMFRPSFMDIEVMLMLRDVASEATHRSPVPPPACLLGLVEHEIAVLELMIPSMLRAAAGEEHAAVAEQLVAALKSEPAEVKP